MNTINENYLILNEIFTKINFFYMTNHIISFYFDNIILLNLIVYIIIREINFSYKIKKIVKFDKSLDNCEKSNYIKQDFEEQNNMKHLEERLKIFEQNNVTHLEERLQIFEQNNVTHLEERLQIFEEQNNVTHLEERLQIFEEQNNVTHLEERLQIFEEQNNMKHLEERLKIFEQNNVTHLEERLQIFEEQNNMKHLEERLKIFEQNNVTHLEERLQIFEEQNNVTHLEERLQIFEEQNNMKHLEERLKIFEQNNVTHRNNYNIFSIVPIGINSLLDINSKKIKIGANPSDPFTNANNPINIKIGNQRLPYLSDINTSIDSKKLYSDFLEQFRNIELIEIEFSHTEHDPIFEYIKIMINTFENFEIIFSCTTLYSNYETFFNILMTSYNYNKITLYIKNNLNVNNQTCNALYVTQPYINKLKDHCIENNIEIQTNIGI